MANRKTSMNRRTFDTSHLHEREPCNACERYERWLLLVTDLTYRCLNEVTPGTAKQQLAEEISEVATQYIIVDVDFPNYFIYNDIVSCFSPCRTQKSRALTYSQSPNNERKVATQDEYSLDESRPWPHDIVDLSGWDSRGSGKLFLLPPRPDGWQHHKPKESFFRITDIQSKPTTTVSADTKLYVSQKVSGNQAISSHRIY